MSSNRSSGVNWGTPITVLTLEAPGEENGVKMKKETEDFNENELNILRQQTRNRLGYELTRGESARPRVIADLQKLIEKIDRKMEDLYDTDK